MPYQRTPPQKSFFAYIIPFLILIILGLMVFMLIRFWNNIGDRSNSETSYAYMQTLEGDAKVMLWGTMDWTSVPQSTIKLFKGDSIRALPGSKVKVSLFEKHNLILNGDSEIVISELRKENQTMHTALTLNKGEAWLTVERDINPNSTFLVKTGAFQIETKGATLDIEPNIVRVLKGSTDVDIYYEGEMLKTAQIGVGQELVLTDSKVKSLATGDDSELISMLSDEFKLSNWYLFNAEGKTVGTTESEEVITDEVVEIAEEENVTGVSKVSTPEVTTPVENGGEFTITGSSQRIEGTADADVAKVVINNYTLGSLKDGKWYYNADEKYGNLKEGKNVYEIYGENADGDKSKIETITLIYGSAFAEATADREDADENVEEEEEVVAEVESVSAEATPDKEGEGELKITEPNEGEDLTTTETSFLITGTAPSDATKITVSGYTLTSFEAGDKTWSYNTNLKYDNITVGEQNIYKVVAYDADDKIIATEELVITVEESEEVGTGTGEVAE